MSKNSQQQILEWAAAVGKKYGLSCSNFTVAWADGKLFCAIIDHYEPSLFSYKNDLKPTGIDNIKSAWSVYFGTLGIPEYLDAQDAGKEKLSMITQMFPIFKHFQMSRYEDKNFDLNLKFAVEEAKPVKKPLVENKPIVTGVVRKFPPVETKPTLVTQSVIVTKPEEKPQDIANPQLEKLKILEKENLSLKSDLERLKNLEKENLVLKSDLDGTKKKEKDFNSEITILTEKIKNLEKEKENLKNTKVGDEWKSKYEVLVQEKTELDKLIKQEKELRKTFEDKISKAESESKKLRSDLETANNEVKKQQSLGKEAEVKWNQNKIQLEKELEILKSEKNSNESKRQSLQEQINSLEREKKILNESMESFKMTKTQSNEKESQQYMDKMKNLETLYQKEKLELNDIIKKKENEKNELIKQWEAKHKILSDENKSIMMKNEAGIEEFKKKEEKLTKENQIAIKTLSSDNEDLKNKIKELQSKSTQSVSNESFERVSNELANTRKEMNSQLQQKDKKIQEIQDQLQAKSDSVTKISKEVQEIGQREKLANLASSEKELEIKTLLQQLQKKETEISLLKIDLQQAQSVQYDHVPSDASELEESSETPVDNKLRLVNRDLFSIPAGIQNSFGEMLLELDLSQNMITTIDNMSKFKHLKVLNLDNNQLLTLEGFPYLSTLEVLSLNDNLLMDLGELISICAKLRNLKHLNVARNPGFPNQYTEPEDYQEFKAFLFKKIPSLVTLDADLKVEKKIESRSVPQTEIKPKPVIPERKVESKPMLPEKKTTPVKTEPKKKDDLDSLFDLLDDSPSDKKKSTSNDDVLKALKNTSTSAKKKDDLFDFDF